MKLINSTREPNERVRASFNHTDIQYLEGQLLTILDAALVDHVQRKAVKDIVSKTLWNWAVTFLNSETATDV